MWDEWGRQSREEVAVPREDSKLQRINAQGLRSCNPEGLKDDRKMAREHGTRILNYSLDYDVRAQALNRTEKEVEHKEVT